MTYKLVESEMKFLEDYKLTFKDEYAFFKSFYSIWEKLTVFEPDSVYVHQRRIAPANAIPNINEVLLSVWLKRIRGN